MAYDPFDESLRYKRTRRKSEVVQREREEWKNRLRAVFAKALSHGQLYVKMYDVWTSPAAQASGLHHKVIMRNANWVFAEMGYVKDFNENSLDGRWSFEGGPAVVYRLQSAPKLTNRTIKLELGV
jgi:hypothetical protein